MNKRPRVKGVGSKWVLSKKGTFFPKWKKEKGFLFPLSVPKKGRSQRKAALLKGGKFFILSEELNVWCQSKRSFC